jgi:tetratricopeptide (TPR) repeat protein
MRFGHLLERDNEKAKMKKEFQELENIDGSDDVGFLRKVGSFVEKWANPSEDREVEKILEERDHLCFQAQKEGVELPAKRRKQILQTIRKAAFVFIFVTVTGFSTTQTRAEDIAAEAKQAFDAAQYEKAAELWLGAGRFEDLSADTLYNIGNAAYRMGAVGQSALYYRRALVRDETHVEARQNLRFIERKVGSITVERPDYQYVLAKLPLKFWRGGLYAGAWILLIGVLVFPATRRGASWRIFGVAALIVGPLVISAGMLGSYHYPDDAKFAPLERQAVIVGEGVVLHSDASRTSAEVIDAPPGSLAEVVHKSGGWAYVGFATQTRGWVPVESLEMILPEKKPEPPKVKKPVTDGSSA